MTTTNESKRDKIILLAILLLSCLFVLGCSLHGKDDEEEIRYEFCPGTYCSDSTTTYKMFYGAVNQSNGQGWFVDSNGNEIKGSAFTSPVKCADDGFWIADGFYEDINNEYSAGTYTLKLQIKGDQYATNKYMSWDGIPTWKSEPTITFDGKNVTATNTKINENKYTEGLTIRYRLKLYVGGDITTSKLFGQGKGKEGKEADVITYSIPSHTSSIQLVPVLACELSKQGRIKAIVYYAGKDFTYTGN